MKITFTPQGWADYLEVQAGDERLLGRLNAVLKDIMRSPFKGIGKPEPLKQDWAGWWSRRITDEHRLVSRRWHR